MRYIESPLPGTEPGCFGVGLISSHTVSLDIIPAEDGFVWLQLSTAAQDTLTAFDVVYGRNKHPTWPQVGEGISHVLGAAIFRSPAEFQSDS